MRRLLLGLALIAAASPAYADVIVDFTFSGKVFATGDVPGGGTGGETATATGVLDFNTTGNAIAASSIDMSISGIPDVQTSFGVGGPFLYFNSFSVSPNGTFLSGAFEYETPDGFAGPTVGISEADPQFGFYSLSNHSETDNYFEEGFDGAVTFTQVTPVSEPWAVAVFATGLLGLILAREKMRKAA